MRALPAWLAGGPEVSDLAYAIVERTLAEWMAHPEQRAPGAGSVTVRDVVDYLAAELEVDEGDVLRAFAELAQVGLISKEER